MKNKTIRLTEKDLCMVIKESVGRILNEELSRNEYDDELLKRQYMVLKRAKKSGMDGYLYSGWCVPFLKSLNNDISRMIGRNKRIHSLWFTCGNEGSFLGPKSARIVLEVLDANGYSGEFLYDSDYYVSSSPKVMKMPVDMLWKVLDCMEKMSDYCDEKKKVNESNPDVSELLPEFLSIARRYAGKDFKVSIKKGKLNREGNVSPYDCIVVEYASDGSYAGSIVFGKDRLGNYTITERVPLAGESTWTFGLNDAEESIKEAMEFICG